MDTKLKRKALQNLAKTAGDVAEAAIRKEIAKIAAVLESDTDYYHIAEQLGLLDTIAYRVYEEAVSTIRGLLDRLKSLELTYQEVSGYPIERLREYQNNFTLMVKAIEVLEHIRYHLPSEILDIFFDYSCHEEGSVSKQAIHGVEEFAGYDLDIFYGDGKDWHGLGWGPQEKILEKIASFDEAKRQKYFSAIIVACEQVVSPTLSGTSSTYKTVTWRTGAVPAKNGVKEIRKKALDELRRLYALAKNIGQKKAVLNAMNTATRIPHMGDYGDDVRAMIIEDIITVAEFMKGVAVSDDMQIMQKVEHDAYWMLYHKGALNESIRKIALEIRDALYADEEYRKFRILIGFESIFHDWEKRGKESEDFDREREFRQAEALKLAETVNADSYDEWKDRIIRYASIESNDMATFPYFGKFLEHLGKTSPTLALKLLSETSDQLEGFIVAILCGVSETARKGEAYSLIEDWCNKGKYLFSLARFFEFSPEVNEELLKKMLDKAMACNDLNALNQIISSFSAQYSQDRKHLIKSVFMPALEHLTAHKNSDWILGFWFRKQRNDILVNMDVAEHKAILNNLFWLQKIDYHAEEILSVIAEHTPELVIHFFCNRLTKEKDQDDGGKYEAVPYSFHKLSQPLSRYPGQAVDAVRNIYDGNYALFIFRGARLLKNIFPNFPQEFQQKLLEVVHPGEEEDLLFVMAVLRNYDGNPVIYNVCKELAKLSPNGGHLSNELMIILESTGVVSGEYGFVEAYKKKIEEIQPWLQDESPKVKEFAQNYISILEKRIEFEQKRADEDITLRKHAYGAGDD